MAINLDKNKDSLKAAWKDVLDEKTETNWALFGYDGLSNDLKFISKGDGGLSELIDEFNGGKIMYAFVKVEIPNGSISKYVLINWQGEGAPIVRKGTCANHLKHVAQFFSGFHTTMHARTEDDLDEKVIIDTLAKAGSAFDFKSVREEIQPSGPIGTVYKKVNPVQEINSKERDQFWMKEEQEEKKRIEAERKRREEEKKKAEEETLRQDQLAAAQRDQREQTHNGSGSGVAGAGRGGEGAREARGVIAAARRRFDVPDTNNENRTPIGAPEKPVRSSVIAQRINAFTQRAQGNSNPEPPSPIKIPRSPEPVTLAPQPEVQKTSPLKNIDKITMSLESPSQIQYEPIIDPADLSPSGDYSPPLSEECIRQNIVDDEANSSGNDNDDDDSDSKFSTIKRSPHTRADNLARQDTVIENRNYNKEHNGTEHHDQEECSSGEAGALYEDVVEPGLTARALYDYQAADETEITFDPGDIITHVEQIDPGWWQGLGPRGCFGLFPANYVELLPAAAAAAAVDPHPLHQR